MSDGDTTSIHQPCIREKFSINKHPAAATRSRHFYLFFINWLRTFLMLSSSVILSNFSLIASLSDHTRSSVRCIFSTIQLNTAQVSFPSTNQRRDKPNPASPYSSKKRLTTFWPKLVDSAWNVNKTWKNSIRIKHLNSGNVLFTSYDSTLRIYSSSSWVTAANDISAVCSYYSTPVITSSKVSSTLLTVGSYIAQILIKACRTRNATQRFNVRIEPASALRYKIRHRHYHELKPHSSTVSLAETHHGGILPSDSLACSACSKDIR